MPCRLTVFRVLDVFKRRVLTVAVAVVFISALSVTVFSQVPADLVGRWSTDQSRCEDNQADGVTVLDIGPKLVSWYEIVCEVRNARRTDDGVFLHVGCEKGGGMPGSGDIDIRRVSPDSIAVYLSPTAFSAELNYSLKRCQGSPPQIASGSRPRTYWTHNGSTVYLVANGSSREFYYERPRSGMLQVGAQRGSLLFIGEAVGNTYEGTAYIFSRVCSPFGYRVSGPILDDHRRVVLRGQAPRVDGRCRITGYLTDILEFKLINQ